MVRAAALVLAVALAGCGPRETVYSLRLITTSCSPPSPMDGVTHFLFRVTGDGLSPPLESISLASARQAQLPSIPAGARRVVEIRGYAGEPKAGGRLVSLGRSRVFDVPTAALPLPQDLTVILRAVNSVAPINLSISPEACARMGYPRAGHTATVLLDGRVLIAGGYTFNPANPAERIAIARAEVFDPSSGGFSDLPDLAYLDATQRPVSSPRAHHTATLLADGRVLLAGGEKYFGGDPNPYPMAEALLFDPVAKSYSLVPMNAARSQHGAAFDSGRVLLLGGVSTGGPLVPSLEWFDPARTLFTVVPGEQYRRVQMGVATVGRFVAAAGGATGTAVESDVLLYGFNATAQTYTLDGTSALLEPRRGSTLAAVSDDGRLAAVGGFSALEPMLSPLASSEVIATQPQLTVSSGPNVTARGDVCAATLADGRVFIAGGRGVDFNQSSRSEATVELMVPLPSGATPAVLGLPALPVARYGHTCTALPDGTVLIAGGVYKQDPVKDALQDAFIFTPAPLD